MKAQLAPGTSFSLRNIFKTSQCVHLACAKACGNTMQKNAKTITLILHFHSAFDEVVFGVYKRVPS